MRFRAYRQAATLSLIGVGLALTGCGGTDDAEDIRNEAEEQIQNEADQLQQEADELREDIEEEAP